MDELDVRILRALIAEREVAPSVPGTNSSLRAVASRLGADDTTVNNRYKKLVESGCLSVWSLLINPALLGYRVASLMVDAQPESGKADMMRKLRLVQEITGLVNFHGSGLGAFFIYNGDESRSRTVELISRVTNAERLMLTRMALPASSTKKLTELDLAIIHALSRNARKPAVTVGLEVGATARTVRKRVERLRSENTFFPFPILSVESIPGLIPVYLSYAYSSDRSKTQVDRAVLSHFDPDYITGNFSDPETGQVVLWASRSADIQEPLKWASTQHGIASARVDIPIETLMFPERLVELLELRRAGGVKLDEPWASALRRRP